MSQKLQAYWLFIPGKKYNNWDCTRQFISIRMTAGLIYKTTAEMDKLYHSNITIVKLTIINFTKNSSL